MSYKCETIRFNFEKIVEMRKIVEMCEHRAVGKDTEGHDGARVVLKGGGDYLRDTENKAAELV